MAIKPQSAKAKGRKFQQWVRDQILKEFPNLHPDDVRSTSMGAGGEDIQLSPAARQFLPLSIECKSKAKNSVYGLYDQAVANAPKGMEPTLFIKADRRKPLAVMDAEKFLQLMRKLCLGRTRLP